MRCCHLTLLQAREYERSGDLPDCQNVNPYSKHEGNHSHVSQAAALRMVANDDGQGSHRWVDRPGGRRFRMLCEVPERKWQGHKCQGTSLRVMQMVNGGSHGTPLECLA